MNGHGYHAAPETDGELLPVVDEDDRVVGTETRRTIHLRGMRHRAVHVILSDDQGRIVLQKRSMKKDHYPGWWDLSVGGHVGPGESYGEAAIREMREEMGITGRAPVLAVTMRPSEENGWEFIHVFGCRIEGDVSPDEDEIIAVRRVDPREFLSRATIDNPDLEWRVTPPSLASIRLWWEAGAPG